MEKYNDSCELTRSGVPLFRLFHNETSLSNNTSASFDASIQNAFDDENFMHEVLNQCKKRKKSLGGISLDKVEVPNNSLFECLAKRRSCRDFSKESVSFKKLSAILFFCVWIGFRKRLHSSVSWRSLSYKVNSLL